MATWQIQIPRDQHTSLQIGDIIYYTNTSGSSNYSVVDLSANATPLDGSNTSAISFFTVGGSTSVFNVNNEGSSGQSLQRLGILQVINNTTSLDDGTETTTLSIQAQSTFGITAPTPSPPGGPAQRQPRRRGILKCDRQPCCIRTLELFLTATRFKGFF